MKYVLTAAAAVLLLFLSTYKLSDAPTIWFDEGVYSQLGLNLAQTGQDALQIAPNMFVHSSYVSVGYPLLYPLAASYKLFGAGVVQGRAVMVLFILLFAAAIFLLVYRLRGLQAAAWSLFALASFAELYGNGKSVLGEVPGLFFLAVTLVALYYLEESNYKSVRWYGAVGFFAGLCVSTKPIFILLMPALCVAWLLRIRSVRLTAAGVCAGLIAFALPFGYWIYTQFGADVTLLSVLHDYVNPYGAQGGGQIASSTIVQNIRRFATEATPMYAAALMLVWTWSLWLRRKAAVSSAEVAAFVFSALIMLAYVRLPGWYRYLFPASAVALAFLPPSVLTVFAYIKDKFVFLKKAQWLPYAALLVLCCGQYYQVFFSSYVAEYYHAVRTERVAAALAALPRGASVFLYGVPELGVMLPTRNYYQYLELTKGVDLGTDELPAIYNGRVDYVVMSSDYVPADAALLDKYRPLERFDSYELYERNDLGK